MGFKLRVEGEVAGYVVWLRAIVLPKGVERQVAERGSSAPEAGGRHGEAKASGARDVF